MHAHYKEDLFFILPYLKATEASAKHERVGSRASQTKKSLSLVFALVSTLYILSASSTIEEKYKKIEGCKQST